MFAVRGLRLACMLAFAMLTAKVGAAAEIEAVLAHPPVDAFYACTEHGAGLLTELGDNLGQDCLVQRFVTEDGRTWARSYATDGSRNEDWFGWGVDLMSPCDCKVVSVRENPVENQPGVLGKPPASAIELERKDGVHFVLAHIQKPKVRVGDQVKAGAIVAKIGNNGYGRAPHLHIGAWKGTTALQIRWDLSKMELPSEYRSEGK